MKASLADRTTTQSRHKSRLDGLTMSTTQPVENDATEITATEFGMLVQIREAQESGETLESIRASFDMAMALVELSEQGRLN